MISTVITATVGVIEGVAVEGGGLEERQLVEAFVSRKDE
jgi:hypothetical protein